MHTTGKISCAILSLSLMMVLGGCTPQSTSTSTSQVESSTSQATSVQSTAESTASSASQTARVATFDGPKYITNAQPQTDAATSEQAVQEACIIRPPEAWATMESCGLEQSSITVNRIATDWGTITYRYEYLSEQAQGDEGAVGNRTTESGYFGESTEISHATIGDRQVSYAINSSEEEQIAFGIIDLEAQQNQGGHHNRSVMLNAWEPRSETCAFTISISCEIEEGNDVNLQGEQLLTDAYAPLEFLQNVDPSTIDAASFKDDLSILSADDAHQLIVHQNGADLLNYSKHSVTLMDNGSTATGGALLKIDFAPEGGLAAMEQTSASTDAYSEEYGMTDVQVSPIEDLEFDGRTYHARTISYTVNAGEFEETTHELRAWTDVDGNGVYVVCNMEEGEDAVAALTRVLAERLTYA